MMQLSIAILVGILGIYPGSVVAQDGVLAGKIVPVGMNGYVKPDLSFQGKWMTMNRLDLSPWDPTPGDNRYTFSKIALDEDAGKLNWYFQEAPSDPYDYDASPGEYILLEDNGQSLVILQETVWMEENLEGYPAGLNYSVLDYIQFVDRLKMMRDIENAPLWLGHSIKQYEAMGEKWYQ